MRNEGGEEFGRKKIKAIPFLPTNRKAQNSSVLPGWEDLSYHTESQGKKPRSTLQIKTQK